MSNIERKFTDLTEFKSLESDAGGFEGYGNDTGVLDSYDDIVLPGAYANLTEFIKHGWTAPDHEWGIKDEIGFITDAREDDRGLFFRSEFHPTPDAQAVRVKAKNRLDNGKFVALSIGYEVLEHRFVSGHEAISYVKNPTPEIIEHLKRTPRVRLLIKIKLYEVSIVSVGANSNSEAVAVKSAGKGAFADAATGAKHRGLMVGVFLSPEAADALAVEGGEQPENLHLTLAYCGDVTAMDDMTVAEAMVAVKNLASWKAPLTGRVNGFGVFNATPNSDDKEVYYAGVDMPGLAELHCALKYALGNAGMPPREDHGFVPHITLAYCDGAEALAFVRPQSIALRFDALTITVGGERTVVPLTGYPVSAGCSPYMYLGLDTTDPQVKEFFAADTATHAGLSYAEHSERTLAVVEGFVKRAQQIQELRTKEGRTLSAANRARMQDAMSRITEARDAMSKVHEDMDALVTESEPKPKTVDASQVRKLRLDFLHTEVSG
jgi:HK97 family phage prohead protease